MTDDGNIQAIREKIVQAHVQAENNRDLEAAMATFTRPRYEIIPTGEVFDGDEAVRGMLTAQWQATPPLIFSGEGFYHGPDGLMVETRTRSRDGKVDMLSVNFFGFEGPNLVLERCYFDTALFLAEMAKLG